MGRSASKLRSTRSGVVTANLRSARAILLGPSAVLSVLCVSALSFLIFLFAVSSLSPESLPPYTGASLFSRFLFLLQYHHWHCSAGIRGLLACATAAQNTSSTQGSCRWPVA